MLLAALAEHGVAATDLGAVGDEEGALTAALQKASDFDIVINIVSLGETTWSTLPIHPL